MGGAGGVEGGVGIAMTGAGERVRITKKKRKTNK